MRKTHRFFHEIFHNPLTFRYILALIILALALGVAHLTIQSLIEQQSINFIKGSFYKSHLEQVKRIRRLAIQMKINRPGQRKIKDIQKFKLYLENFEESHRLIFAESGPHRIQFEERMWPEIEELAASHGRILELHKKMFPLEMTETLQETSEFLKDPSQWRMVFENSLFQLLEDLEKYQKSFGQFHNSFETFGREKIENLKFMEKVVFISILMILLLEGLFIFRPAVARMNESHRAKSRFLSNMGHEIRNPMNLILGMSEYLKRSSLNMTQQECLERLVLAADRLMILLNNILEYSALEGHSRPLEERPSDMKKMIEEICRLVSHEIHSKGLEFLVEVDGEIPEVLKLDEIKVQQVWLNLIHNAIKFTHQGFIKVKWEWRPAGRLTFTVEDTGIGIPAEEHKRIFQRFYQVEGKAGWKKGGAGLGLSIAKELLSLMKGRISLQSALQKGSLFQVDIPTAGDAQARKLIQSSAVTGKGIEGTILLIGPAGKTWEQIRSFLSGRGHETLMITDAKGGFHHFDQQVRIPRTPFLMSLVSLDWGPLLNSSLLEMLRKRDHILGQIVLVLHPAGDHPSLEELKWSKQVSVIFHPVFPWTLLELMDQALAPSLPPALSPSPSFIPARSRHSILLAEDNDENRLLYQLYLNEGPLELTFASNGLETWELLQQRKFDLLFLDIQMPEYSGLWVLNRIQEQPGLKGHLPPTVVITSYMDSQLKKEIFRLGAVSFLVRPFTRAHLWEIMEKCAGIRSERLSSSFPDIPEVIRALIPSYILERKEDLEKMNLALISEDFQTISSICHKIRGNGGSFGLHELSHWAHMAEMACKQRDRANLKNILLELGGFLERSQKANANIENKLENKLESKLESSQKGE